MPEKSHTNPQVTIDHAEYQELLEAQKALEHLMKPYDKHNGDIEDTQTKVIHQYTDYHSKNNYEKRDFYLVVHPNKLTEMLMEHLQKNQKLLEQAVETIGVSYDLPSGRNATITRFLSELNTHVGPKK